MTKIEFVDRPLSPEPDSARPFLDVRDLRVHFATDDGLVKSVDGLSFGVERGRTLGIVGESGSGKSVTSLAVMGLHKQLGQGQKQKKNAPQNRSMVSGEIYLDGVDLVTRDADYVRTLRGKRMAMIFQDPLSSMNPYYTVGKQIIEAYRMHNDVSGQAARTHAIEMLARVGIPEPARRVDDYPHQFSGGMRQRAMIAMALSCDPDLLIADEPTTALDVTVQAQILDLIRDLQRGVRLGGHLDHPRPRRGRRAGRRHPRDVRRSRRRVRQRGQVVQPAAAPLHLGAAGLGAQASTRPATERLIPIKGSPPSLINVPTGCAFHPRCAYAGLNEGRSETERPELQTVEPGHLVPAICPTPSGSGSGPTRSSRGCDGGVGRPSGEAAETRAATENVLEVEALVKHFPIRKGVLQRQVGAVQAVDGVSFGVQRKETFSIVGESGCGKSTTGRLLTRLLEPTGGRIVLEGRDITHLSDAKMRPLRRHVQMIFQDPYSSLNPRHTVGTIVGAPFRLQKVSPPGGIKRAVQELLEAVGLNPEHYNRYPHEFSGGQRQRIGIARTLALRPRLIVADEPVSALDVSIQAQIINLLEDLQHEFDLTYVIIAHDLSVVRHVSDRVAVMYLGKIVELADAEQLYSAPMHPYTVALMSAVPVASTRTARRERIRLVGDVPSPINPPPACRFHTRCWKAQEVCQTVGAAAGRAGRRPPGGLPLPGEPAGDARDCQSPMMHWSP